MTPDEVLAMVATEAEIPIEQIVGRSREKHVQSARRAFVKLAHDVLGVSFPRLGEYLGNRHHTTVLHAYYYDGDVEAQQIYESFRKIIEDRL